ncbi:MAG: hypothetical protein K6A73_04345 [Bacteroidales bacterium]|nr:hypothetical protein [Bacteroidales bacterium]
MEENKKDNSSTEKPRIEIEINKYKRLVDVLNSPKLLARAIVVMAVIITLVFVGVSVLAMVIKGFYPYKAVETNKYGATVIKNENTEVTYWLFNSADLWANSGIKVEKGQRITVRTSGAFHSAIHHLVQDADKNQQRDKWLNATGGMQSQTKQDKARAKYRIAPEYEFNTIIMQVIPEEVLSLGNEWYSKKFTDIHTEYLDYVDGMNKKITPYIYKIGAGYENIEIQNDGILCFACNDIALTDRVIDKMKKDKHFDDLNLCKMENKKTELDYYKETNFVDAWFVDNVGSFLIIVESEKK